MYKDNVAAHIDVNLDTKEIVCVQIDQLRSHSVFGKRPHTVEYLNEFLEERCVPRTRYNIKELLADWGLQEYNPLDICKRTHGVMSADDLWIRFEGEDLKYKDVAVIGRAD